MKSLKQLLKDKRIYTIEKLSEDECEQKYFVWLNDGYAYEDGSSMFSADSVEEINEELAYVKPE